jgi:ligand-binding sensor domain-containing protein
MSARWLAAVAVAIGMSLAPESPHEARREQAARATPPPNHALAEATAAGAAGPDRLFVRTIVAFRGRVWVGTFNDGLFVIDASLDELIDRPEVAAQTVRVPAPFRMVNDALELGGSLYVAANEGLFVSADGTHFERVRQVETRGVTALATDGRSLYATTTSALWKLRPSDRRALAAVWWKPAGSRSLQGVVVEKDTVWLASEDRGAIRFDGRVFTSYDRLFGLPTSWVVSVTGDTKGGVYAATLRDGAMHIGPTGAYAPLAGLPSPWGLTVVHADGEVCVGTQDGAACYGDGPSTGCAPASWLRNLDRLPDPRVHAFLRADRGLVVGTEAGIAVYPGPSRDARSGHPEFASLTH